MGLRSLAPLAHRVRVLASVGFHGGRSAAVGVAFAQHGVHGAAEYLAVARACVFLRIGLRVFREVGDVVAQGLQFGDGGLELRHGSADVGQFDDVGIGLNGQLGKLGQVVVDFLVSVELVGKARKNAPCKRDVACFDGYVSGGGEGFYNRKKRIGSQRRGFVGEGIDDLRRGGHLAITLFLQGVHRIPSAPGRRSGSPSR